MFKILNFTAVLLCFVLPSLGLAKDAYVIQQNDGVYSFLDCTGVEFEADSLASCKVFDRLNSVEMNSFYENLESGVDGALYKKTWTKRGLFVVGVVAGAIFMMTPPGQALAVAVASGTGLAGAASGSSLMFGAVVAEYGVYLGVVVATPLITGGVSSYTGGKLVENQLEVQDIDSGETFVSGMMTMLDESEAAVIGKSQIILDALESTKRIKVNSDTYNLLN